MELLRSRDFYLAKKFLGEAQKEAIKSTCLERKCGSVIVLKKGWEFDVFGRGYNSPPGDLKSQRRCGSNKKNYDEKVTDKTCCVHAEQRAISDFLRKSNGLSMKGSIIYFVSVDENGERIPSKEPYCTSCSKTALDAGIDYWVLEHEDGIYLYESEEYNDISFEYGK